MAVSCGNCLLFQQSETRFKRDSKAEQERFCPLAQRFVVSDKKACTDIEPSNLFWCEENQYQMDINACVARKNKGFEGCVRCSQWRDSLELLKTINRRKLNGIPMAGKPPEAGNNHEEEKPKLRKLVRRPGL